jgi:hypothetical protein
MAALASISDVVHRLSGGSSGTPETIWALKLGRIAGTAITAPVVGRWNSCWQWDGIGGSGATPAGAAVPTRATTGALGQADAGGDRQKWLVSCAALSSVQGTWLLYDRLLHNGGLDGTSTGAQDVGGSLTRNTGGVGNQIWVEIYGVIGTTARTITASYTNQAGTASQTTPAVAIGGTGLREAGRMIQMPLAAGDTGVQSVETVTIAGGSTGTAGAFGVTLLRPLALVPAPTPGLATPRNWIEAWAIPEVVDGACLALAMLASDTAIPTFGPSPVTMVEA